MNARELYASWVNGNKTEVASKLCFQDIDSVNDFLALLEASDLRTLIRLLFL